MQVHAGSAVEDDIDYAHADEALRAADAGLPDAAPEPVKVLDTFLQRFRPNGWSGSLADTLATRMPLIEVLKQHPNQQIAAWANVHAPSYEAYVSRQRAHEAAQDRVRDQAFE